jgi:aryl-alcohol dehydrogenase-like predicted oxidoreductase
MQTRTIAGRPVSAIGLGAMPMSLAGRPDTGQSIRTIHAALDAGVRLIDTADAYCENEADTGHNERLIATALSQWSGDADEVLVATKGGHTRTADGGWEVDGRPEYLRSACEASLKALGVDAIGLYQYHRPDPEVPYAESVGALRELQEEGKIQLAGISNASVEQIREAMSVLPLASVQNEFSPRFRSSEDTLAFCDERGIAFLPWSPLGGIGKAKELGPSHSAFADVADERGLSPHQVALAWELAKAPVVIPIPGASRPETILDSLLAADLELTPDELARLDES